MLRKEKEGLTVWQARQWFEGDGWSRWEVFHVVRAQEGRMTMGGGLWARRCRRPEGGIGRQSSNGWMTWSIDLERHQGILVDEVLPKSMRDEGFQASRCRRRHHRHLEGGARLGWTTCSIDLEREEEG